MSASLVGSEMCIRDSSHVELPSGPCPSLSPTGSGRACARRPRPEGGACGGFHGFCAAVRPQE
eukprot:15070392-Alexandrium_andersonii.AAC.1